MRIYFNRTLYSMNNTHSIAFMIRLWKWLNQPFAQIRRRRLITLLPGLIVISLLCIFRPFGLEYVSHPVLCVIIFGLFPSFLTFLAVYIGPLILPRFYSDESRTLAKHCCICLAIIFLDSIFNHIFYIYITGSVSEPRYNSFFFWFWVTFSVGLIPVAIITCLLINEDLKYNLDRSKNLQANETTELTDEPPLPSLVVLSGNTNKQISVAPENILYIEACGNYISINYTDDKGKLAQTQLRATISRVEEQLNPFHNIIRCHRAFLVNTSYVNTIRRNSSGLLLYLEKVNDEIPVSRTYTKAVSAKLEYSSG